MPAQRFNSVSYGDIYMERGLVMLGFGAIVALFVAYNRYQDPGLLTPDAIGVIQRIAYGFYIALAASLGAIALGLYKYHKAKAGSGGGLLGVMAAATLNQKSRRIFIVTFVVYGVFFSLASGTLVYQPEVNFVTHYGADIPSGFVSPCCDNLGYMPKIIVYLSEHVGLQVIPINLVLQITVSYLVGLNVSIALRVRGTSGRGVGGVGAAAGLFIACPTCAGTFLSLFVGTASGIALSLVLVQLQTIFIAVSIPVLLLTPFLMAKKLQSMNNACGGE